MATIKEIIDYICETTYNTNPNVVRSFLENSDTQDEDMPEGAVKIFTYEVPVKSGALDDVTVDELKAIEAKGVKLFVGDVEVKSVTHETNAFTGTSAYIKTNTCYVGTATITKTGTVSTTETEYEAKTGDA